MEETKELSYIQRFALNLKLQQDLNQEQEEERIRAQEEASKKQLTEKPNE